MPHMLPPSDRSQIHTVVTSPIAGGGAPTRAAAGTFEDAGPEPLDWRRVQAALSRWKWLILGIIVVGTLAGGVATRLIAPTYVAHATIWIDPRARTESGPVPFQAARLLDPEAWTELMRSYAVLDDVARSQRLYLDVDPAAPAPLTAALAVTDSFVPGGYRLVALSDSAGYLLEDEAGNEIDRAALGAPIGRPVGLEWTPPGGQFVAGGAVAFELVSLRDASATLAKNLQLHIDREGNLLRLELEGTDRLHLAPRLNAVAERYVAVAGELKRQKVTELTGILATQLLTATGDLNRAESTYQVFRTRTITLPNERLGIGELAGAAGGDASLAPVVGQYLDHQMSFASVRRDREAIERALRSRGARGVSVEALNAVEVARTSPILAPALTELSLQETQLRQLRTRYTAEHPEVAALDERVTELRTRTIPALAEELVDELRTQEALSGREVALAAASLRQVPARSLEEARLRRSLTLAEALHNTLQQRHEESQMAEASAIPDARILDRAAVPQHPTRDTSARIILLAVALSIALGVAVALLLDRVDPRFRYPTQVLRELRLPILGALPHIRMAGRNGNGNGNGNGSGPDRPPESETLVESMRGLRMALLNDAGGEPSLVIAVSSPGSGDGKSFIATHLAQSFAAAGFNTLLVDGDLRRGRLHQRFGRDRRPGLCDLLQEMVELDAAVQPTGITNLSLLPCGSRLHHAPELLGGQTIVSTFESLRTRFEVIVCDTPPLTAGIDPYLLSVAAGRLLLVLRAGVSHREMMAAKLAVLDRMPIRMLGVVMNDVPLDDAYGYYSYHLTGYETHDERVPTTAVTVQV